MELWLTLVALYGLQCLVHLSRSELLFVRRLRSWHTSAGPGWKLTHPLAAGAAGVSSRLPLIDDGNGGLLGLECPSRWGLHSLAPRRPRFAPGPGVSIECRGHVVRVDGTPFYRAASRSGAARLAGLLADLVEASPGSAEERLRQEIASSLSLEAYRGEAARLREATGFLKQSTRSYLALFLLGLPAALWLAGEERGLLWAFPVLASVHAVTLFAMARAHGVLFPGDAGRRFEDVLSAAVYPPLLLRALASFELEILGRFHPAVRAVEHMQGAEQRVFLRSEIARVELALERDREARIPSLESHALCELLSACGESRESVFAAAPGQDTPGEGSYCPICSSEYQLATGRCADCGARLLPFPR